MKKDKKVIFSEEIDSSISGFALGISFVLLAGLIYYFDFFQLGIADRIVSILLLIFGIVGTCVEIFLVFKFDQIILNIVCAIVLFFSLFATTKGLIEFFYSLKLQRRKSQNKKIEVIKFIAVITELLALGVAIFQFLAEIYKVQ